MRMHLVDKINFDIHQNFYTLFRVVLLCLFCRWNGKEGWENCTKKAVHHYLLLKLVSSLLGLSLRCIEI